MTKYPQLVLLSSVSWAILLTESSTGSQGQTVGSLSGEHYREMQNTGISSNLPGSMSVRERVRAIEEAEKKRKEEEAAMRSPRRGPSRFMANTEGEKSAAENVKAGQVTTERAEAEKVAAESERAAAIAEKAAAEAERAAVAAERAAAEAEKAASEARKKSKEIDLSMPSHTLTVEEDPTIETRVTRRPQSSFEVGEEATPMKRGGALPPPSTGLRKKAVNPQERVIPEPRTTPQRNLPPKQYADWKEELLAKTKRVD